MIKPIRAVAVATALLAATAAVPAAALVPIAVVNASFEAFGVVN